jgi:hypothetical protein
MPFAPKINQDQSGQPQGQGTAPMVSGVSSSFNVPGSGGKVPGAAKTQKTSGQFQNLEKYIQANQPQGETLGQKIAQNVESKVGASTQQMSKLQGEVAKPVEYNPQEAINRAQSLQAPEVEAYKQMKATGGYTGPQDITGLGSYGEAFKQSEAAKEAVSKAQSEAGQQALLQETFKKPTYSTGQSVLDQIILQGSTGGKQAIQTVGEKYKNLSDILSGQFTGSQKQIEQAQAQAAQNKANIAQAEKAAMSGLLDPLQALAEKKNIEIPEYQKRISEDIKDLNLSPETLAGLGLNVGQKVYDINLGNYITSTAMPQTINTVATPEERLKYQALSNLFDQNAGLISATNPAQGYEPVTFNKEQLAKDIATKQKEFEDFAKNRKYSQSFNFGGRDSVSDIERLMGDYGDWSAFGSVYGNLADYLNRGESAIGYGSFGSDVGSGNFYQSAAPKKQAILDQIKKDLETYKYYNQIGEA